MECRRLLHDHPDEAQAAEHQRVLVRFGDWTGMRKVPEPEPVTATPAGSMRFRNAVLLSSP